MPSSSVNENDVAQLAAMGFSESRVREALQIAGGNPDDALELALDHLLSCIGGGGTDATTTTTLSARTEIANIVQGNTSQYTFAEVGRSACTCIALTGASMVLCHDDDNDDMTGTISPNFLDRMIARGIENYQGMSTASQSTNAVVEHMSAEEVLQLQDRIGGIDRFAIQIGAGGVRQGILGHDRGHPLGLKAVLGGICAENRDDGDNSNKWICVLMTKTPETVLICIPPSCTLNPGTESPFWLIDSHPRPQLGVDNACAVSHPTLEALLQSLYTIFPVTDLGSDVPEMMAQIYNSFDLYPLERLQ